MKGIEYCIGDFLYGIPSSKESEMYNPIDKRVFIYNGCVTGDGKGLMVFKQVPAHIESDIIPKMQSLPQSAKDLILKGKGFIDYTSQCLIYNENTGRADSWVPSISDVFAEDWEIVQ